MPWYYAGPDAKPVGPVSLDELQALRAAGTVSAETFIIEHTGPGSTDLAWKRYREVFAPSPLSATAAVFPPVPPTTLPPTTLPPTSLPPAAAPYPPAPAPTPMSSPAPHPLFPSAAPAPTAHPLFPASGHPTGYPAVPPARPTNGACAWGFGLALAGLCFSPVCGIGLLPALVAFVLCIVGLVQVSRNRLQSGQGLGIAGLILSGIALVVALGMILWMGSPFFRTHGMTVTEQSSNDSE